MGLPEVKRADCTCKRPSTDGCTELSCVYHGSDNRRKLEAMRRDCPVHSDPRTNRRR